MPGNGTELASAYVTILPSTKGLGASLNSQLVAPVGSASKAAGNTLGKGMAGGIAKIGSALAAVGVLSFLNGSVKAAKAAQVSIVGLQRSVENTGASWGEYKDSINSAVQASSRLAAVDDEDLQDALGTLVQITGNVDTSMSLLNLTTDLARAKNIDLATAAKIVGRVQQGNTGMLTRYGIVLDKNATATEALAEMQKKFGGAAADFGKTAEGATQRFNIALEGLQETIGDAILPTITKLADGATVILKAFDDLPQPLKDTSVAIGAVGTAALIATPYIRSMRKAIEALEATAGFKWLIGKLGGPVALKATAGVAGGMAVVGGAAVGLTKVTNDLNKSYLEQQPLIENNTLAYGRNAGVVDEYTGALLSAKGLSPQIIAIHDQHQNSLANLRYFQDELNGSVQRGSDKMVVQTIACHKSSAANKDLAGAASDAAGATDDLVRAMNGQKVAADSLQGKTRSLTELDLAQKDAAIAAAQARKDYDKLIKDGKKGTDESRQAYIRWQEAQLRAADATADLTSAQKDAGVQVGTTKGKVRDYAAELGKLPGSVTTTVTVKVKDEKLQNLINHMQKLGMPTSFISALFVPPKKKRANGGHITSPEVALIGEAGDEWVINPRRPNAPALIASAAADAGLTVAGGGGVHIEVYADSLSDRRAIHEVVLDALAQASRGSRSFAFGG